MRRAFDFCFREAKHLIALAGKYFVLPRIPGDGDFSAMPIIAIAENNGVEFWKVEISKANSSKRNLLFVKPTTLFYGFFDGTLNRCVFVGRALGGINTLAFWRTKVFVCLFEGRRSSEVGSAASGANGNYISDILGAHSQFLEVHPRNDGFRNFIVICQSIAACGFVVMDMTITGAFFNIASAQEVLASLKLAFNHHVFAHNTNDSTERATKQAIQRWVDMTQGTPVQVTA